MKNRNSTRAGSSAAPLRSFFMRALCAVWLAAVPMLALGSAAQAQDTFAALGSGTVEPIVISPGFTLTIRTDKAFSELVVGNPGVADVFPLTNNSIYVQANSTGSTNIAFYDAGKQLIGTVLVSVRIDFGQLQTAIDRAVPSARVEVSNVNNRIRLSGEVKDNVDLARVLDIARQYTADPERDLVVNAIRVTDPQQVQLDVRILEVSRNAGRSLGVELDATHNGADLFTTEGSATTELPFGSFVGGLLQVAGADIDVVINALESKGLARRLANPTLVTTSGIEANFVVGGEVPISRTVTAENGSVSTETAYREYGVRLNFRPVVLDGGMVSLRVRPEVSDVDTSLNVNGQPAFISRKADTTVSLRDGQSFAIAGLLQVDNERNVKQVPWIGQIPVLGALFRSTAFQKKETDLVIVVTPHLVQASSANQPTLSPLDGTRSSNDVELFLLGMLEVDRDMIISFRDGVGIVGPYGHMIDLEFSDALVTKK